MSRLAAVVLVAVAVTGCANRLPEVTLAPGQVFRGPYIDVRAPLSPGWTLTESGERGLIFARTGALPDRSYVAQVTAFAVSPFDTPDEFLAIIKDGFARDYAPPRFQHVTADFQLTGERPYPCIRLRASSEDTQPQTGRGTGLRPLHTRALYCQHPMKRDLGFQAAYSQRGGPPDADLDAQAQSFIDGVQVAPR